MRYRVDVKMKDGSTETLAKFKYYDDVMQYLIYNPELRTVFDERGVEDYNPNTGVYTEEGCYNLFNSPHAGLIRVSQLSNFPPSKREVAERILGKNTTFDYAIPSPWVDKIVDQCEHVFADKYQRHQLYATVSGGTVWLYPKGSVYGLPAVLTQEALELMLWVYGGERNES